MKLRIMKVRDTTEVIHNVIVNINGGAGKKNWQILMTISADDNRG